MEIECIIKLGGSAVTKKDEFETVNMDTWPAAMSAIKKVQGKCIIVHGAGSFGHFHAKKFKVADGFPASSSSGEELSEVRRGFVSTRLSVTKLNHLIVTAFAEAGFQAVAVSTCNGWRTDNRSEVISSDLDTISGLLQHGFLPIIHGDCVLDETRGCTILSGDTVIEILSSHFKPKRVIFLTDVDGVFTHPPDHPETALIPVVHFTRDGKIATSVSMVTRQQDITGGMEKKLNTAWNILRDSEGAVKVFICNIASKAAERACSLGNLDGERGTEVRMLGTKDTNR